MVTSNHVVDEFATGLARLASYGVPCDAVEGLLSSRVIEVIYSTEQDEIEALRWIRKYADQEVSFTDCTSFAIMRRYKIRTAFTFDRHFRLAGFNVAGLR